MVTARLTVQPRYFDAIKNGTKIVEGRIGRPKYRSLRAGDAIIFQNGETHDVLTKTVAHVELFPTFRQMLQTNGLGPVFGDVMVTTLSQACEIYYSFGDYKTEEANFGVVAIYVS